MKKQSGFTLIELLVVMTIIGVLAAIAMPKFVSLATEAETVGVEAQVASIESAARINAAAVAISHGEKGEKIKSGMSCATAVNLLMEHPLASKYKMVGRIHGHHLSFGDTYRGCKLKFGDTKYNISLIITG